MIGIRRKACLVLLIACGITTGQVWGAVQIEDFEGGPDGGFNNPVFDHEVLASEVTGLGPIYEFAADDSTPPDHSLHLFPATDYITFNLDAGAFVDYAEVWMMGTFSVPDGPGIGLGEPIYPAMFRVLGVDGSGAQVDVTYNAPVSGGDWHFYSTDGAGFAEITEIRLTGVKTGSFDDLTINITPEPATLGLLALGLVGLVRHRPRKGPGSRHH